MRDYYTGMPPTVPDGDLDDIERWLGAKDYALMDYTGSSLTLTPEEKLIRRLVEAIKVDRMVLRAAFADLKAIETAVGVKP